jgi:hypothetical protein
MSVASYHSDDDKASQASSSSITNIAMKCPYCDWNKQSRYLFKHILTEHRDQIYNCIGVAKKIKEDLEEGNCLELFQPITTYRPDDEFKEFPETRNFVVFGCMACKASFQKLYKSQMHWRTSKKCHAEHTKQVKKLIMKVEQFEQDKSGKEWIQNLSSKELDNCIERYRRWYWRILQCDIPWLQNLAFNKGLEFPEKYTVYDFKEPCALSGKGAKLDAYLKYSTIVQNLNSYITKKFTFPSDYQLPNPIGFDDSFEGLPPVGTDFNARQVFESVDEKQKKYEELQRREEEKLFERLQEERKKIYMELHQKAEKEKEQLRKELEEATKKIKEEAPLPVIHEETIGQPKQKRNSFTIPKPDFKDLMTRATSPQRVSYPQIISDTKKIREAKRPPPV